MRKGGGDRGDGHVLVEAVCEAVARLGEQPRDAIALDSRDGDAVDQNRLCDRRIGRPGVSGHRGEQDGGKGERGGEGAHDGMTMMREPRRSLQAFARPVSSAA